VLPAICTEEVITLGAELEDGTVIRGQNNISHPDMAAGPECAGELLSLGMLCIAENVRCCLAGMHAQLVSFMSCLSQCSCS
jgi:hypothetical protein